MTPEFKLLGSNDGNTTKKVATYGLGLIVCLALNGFSPFKPASFPAMGGDNLFALNYAKNYINGHGFRYNPSLGFPAIQDNLSFPSFDFSYRLFLRIVGNFTTEAATSYYLMYLVGVCAMFAAAAYALRALGFRHLFAALGATVYVVSPYFVFRSLTHDFLALYFSAPLGAMLALKIGAASQDVTARRFFREPGVLLSLVVIATSGLYYAFFFVLFATFAGLVASLSQQRLQPLLVAGASASIVFLLLVVTGFGTGLFDVLTGKVHLVRRFAFEQLDYGLTLAEGIHVLANLGPLHRAYINYVSVRPHLSYAAGLEEWPGILLTGVILGSIFLCVIVGARKQRHGWTDVIYLASALIIFGIIYSVNGGLAYYFNSFISPSIRATARVMPFLAFFAVVITLASCELLLRRGTLWSRCSAVLLIISLIACMLPSVGAFSRKQNAFLASPSTEADLRSIRSVLAEKDRAGLTAILQLPHVQWPEAGPVKSFEPYSALKYFILDRKHSATKWSYGASAHQQGFIAVKNLVQQNKSDTLASAAMQLGFDGILVEKAAFGKAEEAELQQGILMSGRCKLFEDSARVLFSLKQSCGG